jgi:type II secretory pathway pseudopilin PulG
MKKGAMFGLDARIALAIFGALSVISGAALYSAIQDSKITSLYTQMTEVSKAVESFYLDTGRFPTTFTSGSSYRLDLSELVENPGFDGWKGPYTSLETSTVYLLNPYTRERITFLVSEKDKWSSCNAGVICEGWVLFYFDNGREQAQQVDNKFDDGDLSTGNVKGWTSSGTLYALLIKAIYITKDIS